MKIRNVMISKILKLGFDMYVLVDKGICFIVWRFELDFSDLSGGKW